MNNTKIYYGWYVTIACAVAALSLGGIVWTFGVFFKPLENEFGWSRTLISSGYTAFLLGHAISILVAGRLVDKYSPRPILFVSAVTGGLSVALASLIHSVNELRFFMFLAGMGTGANWSVPAAVVQRWFYGRKHAGVALSIMVTGLGVGALVFAPLINYLILSYGWRTSYLVVGIIFFVVVSLATIFIRPSPSEKVSSVNGKKVAVEVEGWSTRQAMATAAFAGIIFLFCIGDISFMLISVHLIPHALDVGISPTLAASALGLMGGFSIPGRLSGGFLAEKLSWERLLAYSSFGMAASIVLLIFMKTSWVLYLFVFLHGLFFGVRAPAMIGILSSFFGMRSFGALIGITGAITVVFGAMAPYLAGFIFDTTGSYFWAFMLLMVALVAAGVVAKAIKKPVTR